jgi:N-terminal 7TM region of histidine kinase
VFNWNSASAFGGMLLFWMLAVYGVTRSPRRPVALLTAAAQVTTAAFLLGQGMESNAPTLEDFKPWARNLDWGSTLAPTLWFWMTLLVLREQPTDDLRRYLRWIGYPLGAIFAVLSAVLTVSIFAGDALQVWSAPFLVPPEVDPMFPIHSRVGPLYPGFVALAAGTTFGAVLNLWIGGNNARDGDRRRHLRWLLVSAVLFLVGANSLALTTWLNIPWWSPSLSDLTFGAGLLLMALHVAAYSLFLQGQVLWADLLYFLTALFTVCAIYALVIVLSGGSYSFRLLEVLVVTLLVVIPSHALIDVARRGFDRLFFGPDVRRLRADLATAALGAGLAPDITPVLDQVQSDVAEISEENFDRITEKALRRLNNPAALAACELVSRLPQTLAAQTFEVGNGKAGPAPLDQARAMREILALAIERLKPPDLERLRDAPAALQYNILRAEYLQGMPNKQIMTRHSISDGTFHRNRREAIGILARDIKRREELHSRS